jgi:acetylornithine deacetylase/succinyl-diaminopimelate desuccinylase-like protein
VKLALTCGEETTFAFNGAEWLAKNKRDLIDAEFALNEGGGGRLDAAGNRLSLNFQVGEKAAQNYTLEITNPGGHSSTPVKDNAITALATGLVKLGELEFPVQLSDTTRAYFAAMAKIKGGETREAVNALLADSTNKAADATLSKDRSWHSMLRTTCVATLLNAGHAENALPQRARANINCRIFPGTTVEDVRKKLEAQLADPRIAVTANAPIRPIAPPPPLSAKLLDPATKLAAKMWPGVPIVPVMSTGASDGIFLTAVGIPTYGVPGVFGEPDGGNFAHGLNERVRVRSVYEGRDFLQALVKAYAETP